MRELTALKRSGWVVDAWIELVNEDPVRVARELSEARSHVEHHEVLRRRLSALPWERDIELGLEVELHIKQPHRLNHLSRSIPSFTTHLASRPVEDATYRLHLWQPERTHPTLVPVPEQEERPVLQPVSALDEAHEAMLEAMDHKPATDVEVVADIAQPEEEDIEPEVGAPSASVASTESGVVEPMAQEVISSDIATQRALDALKELIALLGLNGLADDVAQQGMNALPEVRRGLAQHVNITPRDVRVGRLLRLTLRLLPEGNKSDGERARMLTELTQLIAPLKRWMRRRLEARHSGAKGDFLADAVELGTALERIPGLGRHVPLEKDDWPLPSELASLSDEIKKLAQSVNLPSAGGVKA